MARHLLDTLARHELRAVVDKLLVILPATTRPQRSLDGTPIDRYLLGTEGVTARHFQLLKSMVARISALGVTSLQEVFELLYAIVVAVERMRNAAPDLSSSRARELLLWLQESPHTPRLLELIRLYPERARSIDALVWVLYRHFGAVASERISFDVLCGRVPGFADPVDTAAVDAFRQLCVRAFRRSSSGGSGQWFEGAVAGKLQNFSVCALLNDANSKGLKQKGAKTRAGDTWQHAGRDYSGGLGNFDVFDVAVTGPGNRACLGSVADGGMQHLIGKLDILCRPDADQFDRIVEELRFLAEQGKLPGLASLAHLRQAAARVEVASRSLLLVHPDSVLPLRAVVASHPQLEVILDGFMELRGLKDRKMALEQLLATIQPGVDLG